MKIVCSYCKKVIGEKPGEGMTHTICPECLRKYFPEYAEKILDNTG